jgi:hypothetical protein
MLSATEDILTPNYWVKVDSELEKMRKEVAVAYFKEMPQCSLRRTEETRPFSRCIECQVSPAYKSETLLLEPTCAIIRCLR